MVQIGSVVPPSQHLGKRGCVRLPSVSISVSLGDTQAVGKVQQSSDVMCLSAGEHMDEFENFEAKAFVGRLLGKGDWTGFMDKIKVRL